MKKWLGIFALLALTTMANAQVKNPVRWTFSSKKIDAKNYELQFTASIDPGWHIYTLDHKSDVGVATSISVNKNPLGATNGKVRVIGKPVKKKDPSTGELVSFYQGTVTFVQKVTLTAPVKTTFTGEVEFMSCDDKQCLPPTARTFSIPVQ